MALTALCHRLRTPRSTALNHGASACRVARPRAQAALSEGSTAARGTWRGVPQPGFPSARGRPYQLP